MENIKAQLKASEQPLEIWQQEFFSKLSGRKFYEKVFSTTSTAMDANVPKEILPPEFKKRPPHQGRQRIFTRYIKGRLITVFTSYGKDGKKLQYKGWVKMTGRSVKHIFFSSPVLDTPRFFDIMLGWVDAFVDIAEHWPCCKQVLGSNPEYILEHVPGILHMMQFECCNHEGKHSEKRAFIVIEGPFSEKTIKFLRKKMKPSYDTQIKAKKRGQELPPSKRLALSERRKQAIATGQEKP